jgi:hypothetical protein
VVYYMMLSNELPFNAVNALEMATQRVTLDPIPLEDRVPGVDARAGAIVRKLLQKDPNARYASAAELKGDLEKILTPVAPRVAPPTQTSRPAPAAPAAPQPEVPEVEVFGRRRPPPAKPQPVVDPEAVPEISAGPKKRIIEGAPVVPRELEVSVPLPSQATPKSRPLRPEDFPSNPNPKREEPTKPVVRAAEVQAPAKWKHVPPPKRERNVGRNLAFWAMVLAACAALFAVGALGVPAREGDGFWVSLPRPFLKNDATFVVRLALAAGGIGLLIAGFLVNKKQLQSAAHPGPAVMVPIFAALCFYGAGLLSPAQGQGPDLVRSGAEGAFRQLVHPANLSVLAVWSLIAGLLYGLSGQGDLDYSAGSVFLMMSLGALMGFSAGGDIPAIVSRCMETPRMLMLPGGAIGVAFLGLFLAFSPRAGGFRRGTGILIILAALGVAYYAGIKSMPDRALTAPLGSLAGDLLAHGAALLLGIALLSWAVWLLHRSRTSGFGGRG